MNHEITEYKGQDAKKLYRLMQRRGRYVGWVANVAYTKEFYEYIDDYGYRMYMFAFTGNPYEINNLQFAKECPDSRWYREYHLTDGPFYGEFLYDQYLKKKKAQKKR